MLSSQCPAHLHVLLEVIDAMHGCSQRRKVKAEEALRTAQVQDFQRATLDLFKHLVDVGDVRQAIMAGARTAFGQLRVAEDGLIQLWQLGNQGLNRGHFEETSRCRPHSENVDCMSTIPENCIGLLTFTSTES
ncbi:hypothetical protein D3C81_1758030 [compost metagenome]